MSNLVVFIGEERARREALGLVSYGKHDAAYLFFSFFLSQSLNPCNIIYKHEELGYSPAEL